MINKIRNHPQLKNFIAQTCAENNISADIAETIPAENVVILKVDQYYNSLNLGHLGKTPPSVDCLIVQKCADNKYSI